MRLLEEQDVRATAEAASEEDQQRAAVLPGRGSKEREGLEEVAEDPQPCLKIHVIGAKGLTAMDRGVWMM